MVARERITHDLVGIVQHYAPTSTEQGMVSHILNMAALDGASERDQHLLLAGMLVDGLRHGNWPWTSHRTADPTYDQADSDGNYCDPSRQTASLLYNESDPR